jgi:hypothetical protein
LVPPQGAVSGGPAQGTRCPYVPTQISTSGVSPHGAVSGGPSHEFISAAPPRGRLSRSSVPPQGSVCDRPSQFLPPPEMSQRVNLPISHPSIEHSRKPVDSDSPSLQRMTSSSMTVDSQPAGGTMSGMHSNQGEILSSLVWLPREHK